MWRQLLILISMAFLVITRPALAAESAGIQSTAPPLFVELVVNGRTTSEITTLRIRGDQMIVEAEALQRAGVRIEQTGEIDIAHMPGMTVKYDSSMLRLEVSASPDLLPLSRIGAARGEQISATADLGVLFNYDAYVVSGENKSASLWTEQRLFGDFGVMSNDGVWRVSGGGDQGYLRYDTYARFIDEKHAIATTVGDVVTQSLPWTRSVRLGGFQVSRAFRVRPDLVTMPLPSFAGETAVPSAVDLFINGYRQQSAQIEPGRFVLDSVPVVTGAGQARIVTTDAVGRQVETVTPFYMSPTLLKPGLVDFSVEAGMLRREYGQSNFNYGPAAATGVVRYGLRQNLTVEAHAEASKSVRVAGLGAAFIPWRLGTITAAASFSQAHGTSARRWTAGYEYNSEHFAIGYQHQEQEAGFQDLASIGSSVLAGSSRSDRFVGSVNFGGSGSIAIAYIGGKSVRGAQTSIATASYQTALGRRANLLISADHDLKDGSTRGQIRLTANFGRTALGAAASSRNGKVLTELDYSRSMPSHGGLAVSANAASDQLGEVYGQGSLTWRGQAIELQTGGSVAGGRGTAWASASGSLVAMDGGVLAANSVSDAFAVVSTGMPGVGVSYENQVVGSTNRQGRLLIPNVVSFQPGAFDIDTLSLEEGAVAKSVKTRVAVREGAGALVSLPVRRVRSVMMVLVDALGAAIEPGGQVTLSDGAVAQIGWDGLAYLEDVASRIEMTITRRNGSTCRASATVPDNTPALAKIGPVVCV